MKISLEIDDKQARTIIKACNLFMRLQMGQFDEILELYRLNENVSIEAIRECEKLLNVAKHLLTGLTPNSSFSIGGDKVPEDAKMACDIHDVIRHFLAYKRKPEGGFGVDFNRPFRHSKVPLPNISEVEE